MPKENLKDKLDGNELDLSLNNISVVPVKELAALPKATRLDLSCNAITSLPDAFCSLTHLIKIDLSKNLLTELPEHFGSLINLQHLDLLGNQLNLLPVSVCQLKKLKWLDLKDNPLEPELKKVAGDCLDEPQCRKCAQQVVSHMKVISSDMERIRQRKLKEKRELEANRKAKEEEEMNKVRADRKAAKQARKLDQQNRLKQQQEDKKLTELDKQEKPVTNGTRPPTSQKKKKGGSWMSCKVVFLSLLVFIFAALVGIFFYCEENGMIDICHSYWKPALNKTVDTVHVLLDYTGQQISHICKMCEPSVSFCISQAKLLYNTAMEYIQGFSYSSVIQNEQNG
ncbi:hypothetical protein ScPMuIL_010829 [Solemya velum]